MKLIDLKQHSLRYVLLLLFFTASFWSCKKIDVKDSRSVEEHFLTVPANAGPQVKRIIEDLRKKNEAQPFIEAFVATQGYPLWEYVTIKKCKHKNNVRAKDDEDAEEIVEVPVVLNDTKFVNAVLNIKLEEDEILYKLFQGKDWELYGFDKDPSRTRPNANDMVGKIMDYEKLIWGEDIFKVADNKLFDYWPAGDTKPAAFYIRRKMTIDGIIIITVISDCLKPIHDGNLHGVAPGENIPSGFYWGTCTATWVIQEDDPWDPFGGSGNEASGDLAAWANGGGGGGGIPSGTQNEPCNPDFKWIRMEVRNNQLFNPCLQGVVDIDPADFGDVSSSVQDVTNNVTNPCLLEVYNMITANGYKNKVAQLLNDFRTSTTINITINEVTNLPDNIYGQTYGYDPNPQENFNIDLNVNILPHCSKEAIAATYLHEAIHAYLKNHLDDWDFEANSEHQQMFEKYYDDLVLTLKNLFPSLSDKAARCIIFAQILAADDISGSPNNQHAFNMFKKIMLTNITRRYPELDFGGAVIVIAEQYQENGLSGTRSPDCQ